MARLTIYKDNQVDSTVVPNLFIDEYMKDANDAQVKVYLYLLRMMNAHQATSVSDIADKFNHTEKDVIRALKYWEKQQLLDLDFDRDKTLVGIHMRDLEDSSRSDSSSEQASSFVPLPSAPAAKTSRMAPAAVLPEPEEQSTPAFVKPVYSAEQLREFKNRQSTAQLLFIAETYIGKPLTPAEMKAILFFTDELHFSDDLIDYLLQYCVDRGKKDFKYIEKVAISWAEQGIVTPEQAQKAGSRYSKDVYDIVKALGSSNMPTEAELGYITRWTVDYAFSKDIILEACQRTVLAVNSNRFKYADALLKSWHDQNVHQKSDILKIDEAYRQKKKNPASTPRQYANRFNQFAQNTYDFDALEKELLSN
ncbi:MAG: DnaD domain protein [Acetatifactor sp.]